MEMIQKWLTDFRCDRTSVDNTERSGCPKDVSIPEKVEKIHDVMLNNPKVNFWELAEATMMSYNSMFIIKHDIFGMKKIKKFANNSPKSN